MVIRFLVLFALSLFGAGCTDKERYVMKTRAMEPTIRHGDIVQVDPFDVDRESLNRFDLLLFPHPDERAKGIIVLLRLIGLPGEKLEADDSGLFADGEPIEVPTSIKKAYESYFSDSETTFLVEIPENHVFVLGDNLSLAEDSRSLGTIPMESIIGRIGVTDQ